MITRIAVIISVIIISGPAIMAGDDIVFSISPEISIATGHTSYVMDMLAGYVSWQAITLKSELRFPLEAVMVGGKTALCFRQNDRENWIFEFSLSANIDDPIGKMIDDDWIGAPGIGDLHFSHTGSKAEMSHTLMTAVAKKRLGGSGSVKTYFTVGLRYQRIAQKIVGYSGWWIDLNDPDLEMIPQSGTDFGIYYKVMWKLPMAGFEFNCSLKDMSTIRLSASVIYAMASDYDNHLLRNKDAEADATGAGFASSLNLRFMQGGSGYGTRFFFDFQGDYLTAKTEGDQTQSWYGDDPASEEDDTGMVIKGIDHEIKITQFRVGVAAGLLF